MQALVLRVDSYAFEKGLERKLKMKQTIKTLFLDEIEELSRNGGRVLQVISYDTTRRLRKCGREVIDDIVPCYQCLIEEREEIVNKIERVEYQDDKKRLVIHFKWEKPQIIPIEDLIKGL